MDDIFGKNKDTTNQNYIVSSKSCGKIEKQGENSQCTRKKPSSESSSHSATKSATSSPLSVNVTNIDQKQQKKLPRGTGSNTAKTKIELEKQWMQHLAMKEERDRVKNETYTTLMDNRKEVNKVKKETSCFKRARTATAT